MAMRRPAAAVVMGCVVLSAASCAGPAGPGRATAPTGKGTGKGVTASARPTPSATASWSVEDAVAGANDRMRAAATGKNAPSGAGLLVAGASTGGALFVWESADERFCHGAAMRVGMTTVACFSRPNSPPVGEEPRLVPLVRMTATGWNVVFGAEHETVESVTCDGVPVPVRNVGVMADGRRTVHAVEFPELTVGTVVVRVKRGSRTVSETLELESSARAAGRDFPSCGAAPARPGSTGPGRVALTPGG
ncbi:hypothetical protein AB0E83_08135 [Streptomyces sp. NPDC035033]|uniref:hypothetical protein n=1 Tax=Streptomyces sp. NPDC035033 TaxID=3155368 RepID=UPI0033E9039D